MTWKSHDMNLAHNDKCIMVPDNWRCDAVVKNRENFEYVDQKTWLDFEPVSTHPKIFWVPVLKIISNASIFLLFKLQVIRTELLKDYNNDATQSKGS